MIIQQIKKKMYEDSIQSLYLKKIYTFLFNINYEYNPPLNLKVDLQCYAKKIIDNAVLFVEECHSEIVGMVVLYCNDKSREKAYIPLVGVLPDYQRRGIAKKLMQEAISYVKSVKFKTLGIHSNNSVAISTYCKLGFTIIEQGERKYMELRIK